MASVAKALWRNSACLVLGSGPIQYLQKPLVSRSSDLCCYVKDDIAAGGQSLAVDMESQFLFVKRSFKSGFMVQCSVVVQWTLKLLLCTYMELSISFSCPLINLLCCYYIVHRRMFMCFQEEWLMKLIVPPHGMTCSQCLPNEILVRFFLISRPILTYPFTVLCRQF